MYHAPFSLFLILLFFFHQTHIISYHYIVLVHDYLIALYNSSGFAF